MSMTSDGIVIVDEETVGEYLITPSNGLLIAFHDGHKLKNILHLAEENGVSLSLLATPKEDGD